MTERLSIQTMRGGAVLEQIEHELQCIADNVLDPNTDPKATRTLTVKITIRPDEAREVAATSCAVTSKLAAAKPLKSTLYISQQRGKGVLVEHDPKQPSLPLEPTALSAVNGGKQ